LFVWAFYFCLTRRGHGKPVTPSLPTAKVYFCSLDKQPKEEITRYVGGVSKAGFIFCDVQMKDAHEKREKLKFGDPDN
jgi:hypothetical protein